MVTKTYYKTKDYCKVKFSFQVENAETIEILGLNSNWEESVFMSRKKDGSFSADVNLPEADNQLPNIYGGTNSVVVI